MWFNVGLAWQLVVLNDTIIVVIVARWLSVMTVWSCTGGEKIIFVNVCTERFLKARCRYMVMLMNRGFVGCDVKMSGTRTSAEDPSIHT